MEQRDLRETEHGHKGPYLPLIFEACQEDQYAYEYRDGVTPLMARLRIRCEDIV